MAIKFVLNETSYFGKEARGALAEEITKRKFKKVFLVSDKSLVNAGVTAKVEEIFKNANIDYTLYDEIKPNPTIKNVTDGVEACKASGADVIVTVGGGSSMDTAKGISIVMTNPDRADIKSLNGASNTINRGMPVIALPTTAGTGAEVTSFAVISDKEKGRKYPLADYELTPDVAIVDPDLVMSLPKKITADTGMDVLTHAIESYVSNMASDYTDGLAEKAAELVFKNLREAYNNGNNKVAREKMHNASTIAGMAFTNAFLGINHSIAHKMGAEFHLAHGRINAILLPYVIRYNSSKPTKFVSFPKYEYFIADQKYADISRRMGFPAYTNEEGVNSLISEIKKLNSDLGIEKSFKEAGVNEEEFLSKVDMLADRAFEDQCTTANPRLPLVSELKQIMIDAYYGNEI